MRKAISIGNRYKILNKGFDGEEYILSQVSEDCVCLICLGHGNRWENPVKVKDVGRITSREWWKIRGGRRGERYKFKGIKDGE